MRMRLKCIACEVFARPLYFLASRSANIIDIELIEKAQHNQPEELRSSIRARIRQVPSDRYDSVVLAYGLCGKALEGIQAGPIPVVIPRAHDCITLYLGSRERYREEFEREPGTFWYIDDYVERSSEEELDGFGGPGTFYTLEPRGSLERDPDGAPGKSWSSGSFSRDADRLFREYVEKYGEDNARYLIREMSAWHDHYRRAVYIRTGLANAGRAESRARMRAKTAGWAYEEVPADLRLLEKLLNGDWDEDFLMVQPGRKIAMSLDEEVVRIARE